MRFYELFRLTSDVIFIIRHNKKNKSLHLNKMLLYDWFIIKKIIAYQLSNFKQ